MEKNRNDAYADVGTFTVTTEHREDIHSLGNTESGVLVEIWRDQIGDFRRPFFQPSVVIYDFDSGRKLYEAWPQPDGTFHDRDDPESPCEIYYTEQGARMVWIGHDDEVNSVYEIDPETSEIGFGTTFSQEYGKAAYHSSHREPNSFERNVPSPLSLIRDP